VCRRPAIEDTCLVVAAGTTIPPPMEEGKKAQSTVRSEPSSSTRLGFGSWCGGQGGSPALVDWKCGVSHLGCSRCFRWRLRRSFVRPVLIALWWWRQCCNNFHYVRKTERRPVQMKNREHMSPSPHLTLKSNPFFLNTKRASRVLEKKEISICYS
jgi:hypothetical protein